MNISYRRCEPLDALTIDGEALLLLEPDQVVRLSPIATAVFELTATGASFDYLRTQVEAQFGAPAGQDTSEALRAILDDLVEAGVLARWDDV